MTGDAHYVSVAGLAAISTFPIRSGASGKRPETTRADGGGQGQLHRREGQTYALVGERVGKVTIAR